MDLPAKRHLNGVLLAGRRWPNNECWLGSFVIFQGIGTIIAKKTYIFVIFQGGGGGGLDTLSPPLDPPILFPEILDPPLKFGWIHPSGF